MGVTFDPALGYYIINIANTGRVSTLQKMDEYLAGLTPDARSRLVIKTEYPSIYMHGGPYVNVNGWPCWPQPWSSLVAVNVNTGDIALSVPFGKAEGVPAGVNTGAPNSQRGGLTTTAGGVLLIGAATDRLFRAFETKTGKELWSYQTEELIQGNPITYLGKGGSSTSPWLRVRRC